MTQARPNNLLAAWSSGKEIAANLWF